MNTDGILTVTNVVLRQAPQLTATGQVTQSYSVSFLVGSHGPFTHTWTGAPPTPADVLAVIQAVVQQLKALGQGIAQINQQAALTS